jgi:hypothetical protein
MALAAAFRNSAILSAMLALISLANESTSFKASWASGASHFWSLLV